MQRKWDIDLIYPEYSDLVTAMFFSDEQRAINKQQEDVANCEANLGDIVEQIRYSTQRRFYSDDLSQVLLYLGGISCKDYDEKCNIISPSYNNHRKRLLKKNTDYDKIIQ